MSRFSVKEEVTGSIPVKHPVRFKRAMPNGQASAFQAVPSGFDSRRPLLTSA